MAINRNGDSQKSQMKEKSSKNAPATSKRTYAGKPAAPSKDAEKKEELISKGFHPTAVKFLKDELGIDLASLPLSTVYDIKAGRVTEPLDVKVTPLVYDREKKELSSMPPILCTASLRFIFPYDKNFEPVALDKNHKVFVASYPCYEYAQKADPSELSSGPAVIDNTEKQKELPQFSAGQVMALEGIGINENRLYSSSFNSIDVETKRSILDGDVFDVCGYVKTSFGVLNVCGQGKLVQGANGTCRAQFKSNEPSVQGKNSILDIMAVRRIGNLEFDFFERDRNGKVRTDVYDFPILNQAGKDLVNYGVSFEPVDGYLHKNVFDRSQNRYVDEVEKERYQVSVVNGGLCATKMQKVYDLDKEGNRIKTTYNGKEVDKYHYEVADARINSDGTVRVGQENLKFKSEQDMLNYRKGLGGTVEDAKWLEYSAKGGKPKEIRFDAFIVPDNQKNGFAKVFSPATSKKLQERNAPKQKTGKKQNFSVGF